MNKLMKKVIVCVVFMLLVLVGSLTIVNGLSTDLKAESGKEAVGRIVDGGVWWSCEKGQGNCHEVQVK